MMANETRADALSQLKAAGVSPVGYRRKQICARHGISMSHYLKLLKLGEGPRETDVGGIPIVYEADEAAWIASMRAKSAAKSAA